MKVGGRRPESLYESRPAPSRPAFEVRHAVVRT
jgi:hypothetical protein